MEQRGDISVIYKALSSSHWKTPYMLGWETDFAQEWDLEVWHRNSSRVYKGVLNTALVEVNVKVMTRWYLVPFKLAKLYPTASPLCFRGCDMLHVWWDCPKFRGFWNKIFSLIQKITGLPIAMSSLVALLNFPVESVSKSMQHLIFFILLGAKLTIAHSWKSPYVSVQMAKRKVSWIMTREKMVSVLLDSTQKC